MKTRLALLFLSMVLLFTGCTNSKQIDKASIAEGVTVNENNGKREYSFYLLSSKDTSEKITVEAKSFRQACALAKEKYIPDLSLAKLEHFVINENLYKDVLKSDVEYISTQAFFSPQIFVTLSDARSIENMGKEKEQSEKIEEQIILLRNKNKNLNISCLSIYNNFEDKDVKEFEIPCISTQNAMRADAKKIDKTEFISSD